MKRAFSDQSADKVEAFMKKLMPLMESFVNDQGEYGFERLLYYRDELLKYAKFQVGQIVVINEKFVPPTIEDSPGWYCYRHILSAGNKMRIHEVRHYNGEFHYAVISTEPPSWIDSKDIVHLKNDDEEDIFYLCEGFLDRV